MDNELIVHRLGLVLEQVVLENYSFHGKLNIYVI